MPTTSMKTKNPWTRCKKETCMFLHFGSVLIAVLALGLLGCSNNPDFPTCENADPLCFGACDYPDGTSTGG